MRFPPPGAMVDIGGFRLHLHCSGRGSPTVVMDAALGGSSISWTLVQPEIAKLTQVCTYDRAGFGWSDAGPMPRTAARVATELRALLQKAAVPAPYVLVGHSFGGLVMRVFATLYRADVAALVLVDPAHPEDWVTPAPKEKEKIDRGIRLCRLGSSAARTGVARFVAAIANVGAFGLALLLARAISGGGLSKEDVGIVAPTWRLPRLARKPLRQFWTEPKFYDALGSQIEFICQSAAETLDAGRNGYGDLPLVTISSTDPGEYRLRQQESLARLSTRGRHIVASNSGHWIPLEEPQIVIDAIAETLTQVRQSA